MDKTEALKIARDLYNKSLFMKKDKEALETLIPELKESEDERMRRWIINYLDNKALNSGIIQEKTNIKNAIAWLEKQSTPQVKTGLEWVNTIDDACDKRYSEEYAHGEYCHEQSFKWGFQEGVDWLESQGERPKKVSIWKHWSGNGIAGNGEGKNIYLIKRGMNYEVSSCLAFECDYIKLSELDQLMQEEKQGEQKFADDWVTPKFKDGDWVVDENGIVKKILSYNNGVYKHTDGYSAKIFEDEWRLWDITKDAKDGDVLFDGYSACIFRKTMEDDDTVWIDSYCGVTSEDRFVVNDENECWCTAMECVPATKEQRDNLEKAMADAGYEWNAEKKKLKKIEQKPAHIDYVSEIREELLSIEDNAKNINGLTESQWVAIRAAHRLLGEYITKERKPAEWSEDDEIEIQYLLDTLRYVKDNRNGIIRAHYNDEILDRCTNWLKSLKGRVQPKQEWSEEDENRINRLIAYFEDKESFTAEDDIVYANWLKSLKDRVRPRQEWGEEDEKLINRICVDLRGYALHKRKNDLSDASRIEKEADWLKSLRQRTQWKPSDEQMEALEALVKDNNQRYFYTTLNSLYEQLKKLK